MGENFLQMLMGMVNGYLVANLGLSVAGNIITIYQAIFIALEQQFLVLYQKFGTERSGV